MTTIVNTPGHTAERSDGGVGTILGVVIALVLGFLFLYYLLPVFRGAATQSEPQINVPGEIDVNVNPQGSGQ